MSCRASEFFAGYDKTPQAGSGNVLNEKNADYSDCVDHGPSARLQQTGP